MEVNRINTAVAPIAAVHAEVKPQAQAQLTQAVTAVNAAKLFGQDSELTFAMDRETRRLVIRLVDKNTHKVLRQLPPESVLHLAQSLDDFSA